jgi:superfamily II DNA or RNA helicase
MKTPRPYQEIAIARATKDNLLLNDDRGLGKTLVAIETAQAVMHTLARPTLVVCRKGHIPQWQREINEQCDLAVLAIYPQTPMQPRAFKAGAYFVLCTYEALTRHAKALSMTLWGAIIVDEAHSFKNRTAQRTRALKGLQGYRRLALTGSAFDRNPADLWSLLNWLQPEVHTSYWRFFETHTAYTVDYFGHKHVTGVRDPAALATAVAPFVLCRKKVDVAPNLPPKIEQTVPIALESAQRSLYNAIANVDDLIVTHEQLTDPLAIKNTLSKIVRCMQAATDPLLLGASAASAKIDWLFDFIEDRGSDQTLLVFTRFRDTATRIAHALNVPVIVGGTEPPANPADHPIIVGTIDAMGEGFNFGHIFTTVFLDCSWSSIAMQQAVDRTERDLDATQPRHIIYLDAIDTVDQLVAQALAAKWTNAELVSNFLRNGVKNS